MSLRPANSAMRYRIGLAVGHLEGVALLLRRRGRLGSPTPAGCRT